MHGHIAKKMIQQLKIITFVQIYFGAAVEPAHHCFTSCPQTTLIAAIQYEIHWTIASLSREEREKWTSLVLWEEVIDLGQGYIYNPDKRDKKVNNITVSLCSNVLMET